MTDAFLFDNFGDDLGSEDTLPNTRATRDQSTDDPALVVDETAPINTRFPSIELVRASAGTGKTYELTGRLIALLASGEDPGAILATTFTRKAAGEILERVVERLARAAAGNQTELDQLRALGADLTESSALALLTTTLHRIHRLSVLTIDSFLGRLARARALELGIAPDWSVIDDAEHAAIVADSVEAAIESLGADDAVTLVRMLRSGELPTAVHPSIDRAIAGAIETASADPAAWSAVESLGPAPPARSLEDLLAEIRRAPLPLTKAGKPHAKWQNAIVKLDSCARDAQWSDLLGATLIANAATDGGRFCSIDYPPGLAPLLRELTVHAVRAELGVLHDRNRALAAFLALVDRHALATKRARGTLAFADVPRLLLDRPYAGELDTLYFRLDSRLRHILLDEFQDTSVSQFRLIEPLAGEIGQEAGRDTRTVMVVGDPKQSLYGWREAEPGLMDEIRERWGDPSERSLAVSYRSSPAVMHAVNAVFLHIAENPALTDNPAARRAAEEWSEHFTRHESSEKDRPGRVRLLIADPLPDDRKRDRRDVSDDDETDPDDPAPPEPWLVRVTQCVREARAEARAASIGVLVRRNSRVAPIIDALAASGIDASEEAGRPITDSPLVAAVVSLLRFADHPSDTLSLFHASSSPLASVFAIPQGLTNPHHHAAVEVAKRVREQIERRGAHGFVRYLRALVRRDRAAPLDPFNAQRLGQAADLAARYDATRPAGRAAPGDLATLLASARVSDSSGAAVRVMTVHAAKGLEFDAVVLADLDTRWCVNPGALLTRRPGLLDPPDLVTLAGSAPLRERVPELARLYADRLTREIVGELSVLYVAMTRAKSSLDIVLPHEDPRRPSAAAVLRGAHPPEHAARAGDSPAWVLTEPRRSRWSDAVSTAREAPAREEVSVRIAASDARSPAERRTAELESAAPSASGATLRDALAMDAIPAQLRGRRWHAMFELVRFADDPLPSLDDLVANARREDPVQPPDAARGEASQFLSAVQSPGVRKALERPTAPPDGAVTLHTEWPFAARDEPDTEFPTPKGRTPSAPAPVLLQGRVDRLVVVRDARGRGISAQIVDLKTDAATGADPNTLAARYRPQLAAYQRAVARVLGLERDRVTAQLLLIGQGVAVGLD